MGDSKGFLTYLCYSIFFFPVFVLLFVLGILKGGIFSPFVFLVIAFGNIVVLIGLWPYHLVWSIYCMARTKKFGPCMKGLLILTVPIQIALWTVIGVVGSVVMGIGYGFVWPVMETFRAVSKEGDSFGTKLFKCFTAGTWSNVWGACTIVRDFADFSFHSYFSVMEGLLESKGECPIELKVTQIPGCILSAILGVAVDVPMITLIMLYKSPILLFKGWKRLLHDLVGREGPFLETESSTKRGLLYVIAAISLFDEYTNDFLYLPEGSCFPRPRFRARESSASTFFPVKGLHEQLTNSNSKGPPTRTPSEKAKSLSAVMIWNNYFRACSHFGKELLRDGAIGIADLRSWQNSKNKIVNIGIPAYAFMDCFLRSINSGSSGFLMRDNVELTSSNRPEGRVFDWMFEPMSIMKEQLKSLNLIEAEEHYIYKFCLYSGDTARVEAWQNGGYPPEDKIRRAQLEGICRRLLGFCLTLSRLPTSHRRFHVVVREIEQEAKHLSADNGADVSETV
ncbi:hypothetical protein RJ641_013720 [Dillenia turbinata]|uniref:Uncharacterized protein n=1 Tax=Dillenia turbinata TaxID=194707 RepID=A0AAN8WCL3_9MAGN